MPDGLPDDLVTPGVDDDEGAPQKPSRRFPFIQPRVRTKPTRADRREVKRALAEQRAEEGEDPFRFFDPETDQP